MFKNSVSFSQQSSVVTNAAAGYVYVGACMCMLTQDFVANIGSYVTNPSTPLTSFSPFISIFLLFCFLHFPSLLSYFYGSDIYPSETKVCSYNSSLSATLAVFSINHFSPNPNPFSKRKKIKFKYH